MWTMTTKNKCKGNWFFPHLLLGLDGKEVHWRHVGVDQDERCMWRPRVGVATGVGRSGVFGQIMKGRDKAKVRGRHPEREQMRGFIRSPTLLRTKKPTVEVNRTPFALRKVAGGQSPSSVHGLD